MENEKMGEYDMGNPYEAELIGLAADRRGGCQHDGMGMGGIGGFILGAALGGRGGLFGHDGYGRGGCCDDGFGRGGQIAGIMNDNINSRFEMIAANDDNNTRDLSTQIQTGNIINAIRDNADAVCDAKLQTVVGFGTTNTNIVESRYQSALGNQTISKEISEAKFANLLSQKELSMQLAQCCCDIEKSGMENTQKILDTLAANKLDEKNDEIQRLRFKELRNDCQEDARNSVQIIGSSIVTTLTSLLSGNTA